MQEFIKKYNENRTILHSVELIKYAFLPVVIKLENKLEYYKALDTKHTKKDYKPFLELVKKVVEKSFEPYFYVLNFQ